MLLLIGLRANGKIYSQQSKQGDTERDGQGMEKPAYEALDAGSRYNALRLARALGELQLLHEISFDGRTAAVWISVGEGLRYSD